MVAVDDVTRILELRDTDNSLPLIMRKPPIRIDVIEASGFSITSLLSLRRIIEWLSTTNTISLLRAVSTVSPGLMRVCSVAVWLFTVTSPDKP